MKSGFLDNVEITVEENLEMLKLRPTLLSELKFSKNKSIKGGKYIFMRVFSMD